LTWLDTNPVAVPPPPPLKPSKVSVTDDGQIKPKVDDVDISLDPCSVVNPINHQFIDLSSLSLNDGKPHLWLSKAYDKKRNYTLGICANPMKKDHKFSGLNSTLVGGYYIENNTYFSMGEFSTVPKFSGRKLTLTYENGSYCDNLIDAKTGQKLRKTTIITFTCDRELLAKASVQFVAEANDCTYFFEVRSHHACPTAPKANNLAAIWIFLLILLAALAVYFSGGVLYRQLKVKK
jgi:cation-dependent mannose-6-phosphate receptor